MSEPMSKERLENLAAFGRYLYANGCENISELVTEIMRCHAEIERLEAYQRTLETVLRAAEAERDRACNVYQALRVAYRQLTEAPDAH